MSRIGKRPVVTPAGVTANIEGQTLTVKAAGESGTTNGRGRVTLTIRTRRAVKAKASKDGYTGAEKRLRTRGG